MDNPNNEPELWISSHVTAIFEDHSGVLWVGTKDKGVVRCTSEGIQYFSKEEGLAGNEVIDIIANEDNEALIICTEGKSAVDSQGSTVGQIVFVNAPINQHDKIQRAERLKDGLQGLEINLPGEVSDMCSDDKGRLWLAIKGKGIHHLEGDTVVESFYPQHCINHMLDVVYATPSGKVYFGGWGGLHRLEIID